MASRDLYGTVGSVTMEKLIAGTLPPVKVGYGKIRKGSAETAYVRGTLLAKSSTDNKLVILGTEADTDEELVADCVLAEDVTVGTTEDVTVPVYTMGEFNVSGVIVADNYTITEADKDELRKKNIYFGLIDEI